MSVIESLFVTRLQEDATHWAMTLPVYIAETWNEFSALVSPLFAQVEFNRKETLALVAQRDTLLPRLVSGEVGVENHNVTPQNAAR